MGKIYELAIRFLLNKYALGYLVEAWAKLSGYRTQISCVLSGTVLAAGLLGFIPMDKAWEIAGYIGGVGAATFLEKLSKHRAAIDGLSAKASALARPDQGVRG